MEGLRDALKNVTLRKADVTRDFSKPKIAGVLSEEEIKAHEKIVANVNAENWADLLKDYTFPTRYIGISVEQAKAFVNCYEDISKRQLGHPSEENLARLKTLEAELDTVIQEWKEDQGGVFIKLSSRSAKDAAILHQRLEPLYLERLQFLQKNRGLNVQETNTRVMAMLWAGLQILKVSSGKEGIWMLTHSERIWQDLYSALEPHATGRFSQNICVRKWIEIDIDMEFRGFVKNGKLNGLSQYNHLVFSDRLQGDKGNEIAKMILEFLYQSIKPILDAQFQDYVIDFGLTNCGRVVVIELNPFLDSTDGALFSWREEREILENGPFQFRVRTGVTDAIKANIIREWRNLIEKELPQDFI